ncbi:MAG: hypothetical protein C4334_00180 [Pyrinomonas sp.]|uniref:YkvA family protein n=1 Tax=Pyrinomonas sp. TaxID=2080306 RepID=UPI003321F419
MRKREATRRLKELLLFFPNLVRLSGELMVDRRVPKAERALLAAAFLYAITPLDFLPDFIPFLGQVDDAYLIALTVLRLLNKTDERVIREHWHGSGDVVPLARALAKAAPVVLPDKVTRVLSEGIAPGATLGKKLWRKIKRPALPEQGT